MGLCSFMQLELWQLDFDFIIQLNFGSIWDITLVSVSPVSLICLASQPDLSRQSAWSVSPVSFWFGTRKSARSWTRKSARSWTRKSARFWTRTAVRSSGALRHWNQHFFACWCCELLLELDCFSKLSWWSTSLIPWNGIELNFASSEFETVGEIWLVVWLMCRSLAADWLNRPLSGWLGSGHDCVRDCWICVGNHPGGCNIWSSWNS